MKLDELEIKLKDLKGDMYLNEYTYIPDLQKCIKSHIMYLKSNKGNKGYMPYYERLMEIYKKYENT